MAKGLNSKTFPYTSYPDIVFAWKDAERHLEDGVTHEEILLPVGNEKGKAMNAQHMFHKVRAAMRAQLPSEEYGDLDHIVLRVKEAKDGTFWLSFSGRSGPKISYTFYSRDGEPL